MNDTALSAERLATMSCEEIWKHFGLDELFGSFDRSERDTEVVRPPPPGCWWPALHAKTPACGRNRSFIPGRDTYVRGRTTCPGCRVQERAA